MRTLTLYTLMSLSFTLLGVNDTTFVNKIGRSGTQKEKESVFLEWVDHLSQNNTIYCNTIIRGRGKYINTISENGKLSLLLLNIINTQLGGSNTFSNFGNYYLNKEDSLLSSHFIACLGREQISKADFKAVKKMSMGFKDPTRECMYMIISAYQKGISKDQRVIFYKKALIHAKRSEIESLPCLIFNLFSSYYLFEMDFKKSIQNQQKGLTYSKQKGLIGNEIMFLSRVGHMHFELGDSKRAEEFFLEALKLSSGLKLDFILGELYSHLGQLYSAKDELDRSIHYYRQSLFKFYPIKNLFGLATVHNNIGRVYFKKRDLDLAERNYKLSEELLKKINRRGVKGDLFYNMAELYNEKGNSYLADRYINKSINIFKTNRFLIKLNNAYLLYAKIKNKEGDNDKAYHFLERFIHFQDSIKEQQMKENVGQLSELFKSEQKEQKIREQGKIIQKGLAESLLVKNKLDNTKKQNRLILIILIISLILFVAIFFIIRIRGKQERLRIKQREMELQQALLRVQMNPHFIFNSMVAIQSYIYDEDVSNSSKFLIHISKLMRLILESSTKEFISLDTELEIIHRYLILQKMRFENRFDFEVDTDKVADTSRISIPPMLLQPFIENAIEHGGLDQIENGLISISCEIKDDLCIFTVIDNGVGIESTLLKSGNKLIKNHQSMASKLTKERIDLLNNKYKKKGYLRIEDLGNQGSGGTKVTIATPYDTNF